MTTERLMELEKFYKHCGIQTVRDDVAELIAACRNLKLAQLPERMQGVDCPECEDGAPHQHSQAMSRK